MKKKRWIALVLAAVLASMPAVAGAANSPSGSGSGGGSSSSGSSGGGGGSSHGSSTSSGTVITVGSGTTVSNGPSVDVSADGQITTVVDKGTDATGTTIALVADGVQTVTDNEGNAIVNDVYVNILSGAAETAGLPQEVIDTITSLNAGADVASVGLTGYTSVGGTRAVTAKNAAGTDAPAQISMKVDALVGAAEAAVVYYNNNTGHWEIGTVLSFDVATGIVTFVVPGSVTVKFAKK
ncbi:MAG: hypothetical protein ACI39W_10480 [Brotaphodocola sp.]